MKTTLFQLTSVDDFSDLFLGLSNTASATPSDNQWCFNANKELHVKDASASIFGGMQKDFYGLQIGDVIEVSCEVYSISGVLPKIAIDGIGGTSNPGLVNTSGYSYPTLVWKPIKIKYVVQKLSDFYRLIIGVFTSDIAEYKLRNVKTKIASQTNTSFSKTLNISYSTGYTDFSTTYKSNVNKDVDGNVTLIVNCKKTADTDFTVGAAVNIATLPSGYRPKQALRFAVTGDATSSPFCGWGACWIDTAGGIMFRAGSVMKDIGFIIHFPTI